jgi:N6-L-threonylcarbamoyladenine synthase
MALFELLDDEILKNKIVLAFESSFDDMSVAVIRNGIYYHKSSSANNSDFGGGVPEISARHHLAVAYELLQQVLLDAQITIKDINLICSTLGPGIPSCLQIGYDVGRFLALILGVDFIPVHHMEGHLITALQTIPSLVLLISGGHSIIVKVTGPQEYEEICDTIDIAIGDAFDKLARKLGLGFPGGAKLSKLAEKSELSSRFLRKKLPKEINNDNEKKNTIPNQQNKITEGQGLMTYLPTPMPGKLTFSFSGIQTQLEKICDDYSPEDFAAIVENSFANILLRKVRLAMKRTGIFKLGVAGGVAANSKIRRLLEGNFDCNFAQKELCGDNAVMIGLAGLWHYKNRTKYLNQPEQKPFHRKKLSLI